MGRHRKNTCSKDWKLNRRIYEDSLTEDGFNYEHFYNGVNYCTPALTLEKHNHYDECIKYLNTGEKWLDIGCGCGYILKNAINDGIEPYGIDVVDESVKMATQNGIKAIKCSACESYPYDDEYFDFITAIDVLEHLLIDDVSKALKEIYRVLKPGKHLLFASCPGDPDNLRADDDWKRYFHLTYQSVEKWQQLYEEHNFIFVKETSHYGVLLRKE